MRAYTYQAAFCMAWLNPPPEEGPSPKRLVYQHKFDTVFQGNLALNTTLFYNGWLLLKMYVEYIQKVKSVLIKKCVSSICLSLQFVSYFCFRILLRQSENFGIFCKVLSQIAFRNMIVPLPIASSSTCSNSPSDPSRSPTLAFWTSCKSQF